MPATEYMMVNRRSAAKWAKWETAAGQGVLNAYLRGELTVEQAAATMETTPQGVYSAVSRLRRLKPIDVSSAVVKKLEELAELAIPDRIAAMKARISQLEAQVAELETENARLTGGRLEVEREKADAADRILKRARET